MNESHYLQLVSTELIRKILKLGCESVGDNNTDFWLVHGRKILH